MRPPRSARGVPRLSRRISTRFARRSRPGRASSATGIRPLPLGLAGVAIVSAAAHGLHRRLEANLPTLVTDPGLIGSVSSNGADPSLSVNEGQRPDPLDFSPRELQELNRRFGVHGPQPRLAQLFTAGLDQLRPLRTHTLGRLEELRPVILAESRRQHVNPMLVAAVLFDEMQHAKPGEDSPIAVQSGLFSTHGPAQLSVGEMVKQGLLSADAGPREIAQARLTLLDPDHNVQVLVGKFHRLSRALNLSSSRVLMASRSPRDAKALATLAYLHNGKLDYPGRILRYMQDAELHGVIYGERRASVSPLI